ncbi:acetoacetate decarboxylase [Halorhabdus sp. CBA1104]|uniref:acetoacetate decarboxylase family protein n=1 Tax=Halorhabdus sp. CBA1104 TaxID=1380432 RepID=UPI0012B1C23B|nr:acetoacetate decarboxylase family protein [Halorhabdus sp. CBA1104]QGN07113.1 acetoacetate decarboxylase [Halorhabdus sp. CBA1104]
MSETVTVSTGHTFELPVSLSATIVGAVFPADRGDVQNLLPDGLQPVGTRADRATLTVLVVRYDRVGEETIPPYDEVGVLIPAVEAGARTVPYLSLLRRPVSGYVYTLPVTTEPARAFGVDIWGYPKLVADIDVTDEGRTRTATVTADGAELLTASIQRPPTVPLRLSGYNFTETDGELLREPTALRGRAGVWPASPRASISFGDHPIARQLRDVDLGDRAVLRLAADCAFTIGPGEPVTR